jgi:hypothetical protein
MANNLTGVLSKDQAGPSSFDPGRSYSRQVKANCLREKSACQIDVRNELSTPLSFRLEQSRLLLLPRYQRAVWRNLFTAQVVNIRSGFADRR